MNTVSNGLVSALIIFLTTMNVLGGLFGIVTKGRKQGAFDVFLGMLLLLLWTVWLFL